MIIIGIDPSLTETGIATNDGLDIIQSLPAGNSLGARHNRLSTIVHQIDNIVLGVLTDTARADLVVIEAPSMGSTRQVQASGVDRNGLWWLIVQRLYTLTIPVVDVPPATLKKFATGKGNATKPDMRMALYQRAGLDCRNDNKVDAWWLRQVGLHLRQSPHRIDLPKTHLVALDKINR